MCVCARLSLRRGVGGLRSGIRPELLLSVREVLLPVLPTLAEEERGMDLGVEKSGSLSGRAWCVSVCACEGGIWCKRKGKGHRVITRRASCHSTQCHFTDSLALTCTHSHISTFIYPHSLTRRPCSLAGLSIFLTQLPPESGT